MTKIKLCGLTREQDILSVNVLKPDYIGFVFAGKSRRQVSREKALQLKSLLDPSIQAVGVFVDEEPQLIAEYLRSGIIDVAQLHGREDEDYLLRLRRLIDRPLFKAFRVQSAGDAALAIKSSADMILLDSGAGTGEVFDWDLLHAIERPFFLAGGLDPRNVSGAIKELQPWGVDVSSGIETDGFKDENKMAAFTAAVRKGQEAL